MLLIFHSLFEFRTQIPINMPPFLALYQTQMKYKPIYPFSILTCLGNPELLSIFWSPCQRSSNCDLMEFLFSDFASQQRTSFYIYRALVLSERYILLLYLYKAKMLSRWFCRRKRLKGIYQRLPQTICGEGDWGQADLLNPIVALQYCTLHVRLNNRGHGQMHCQLMDTILGSDWMLPFLSRYI